MGIFESFIQGVVQGLTEFLPVSSSGHLTITQHIFGATEPNLFFDVMLHIGTLVAVCVFYYKLLWRLIKEFFCLIGDIFKGKFSWKNMNHDRRMIIMLIIGLVPLFLLFTPIPTTDMQIKDLADLFTGPKYFIVVGIALVVTSVLLTLGDRISNRNVGKHSKESENGGRTEMTVGDAITVGLTQFVSAVFTGLSRSGSTLATAQIRGVNKQTALDYTFIMAVPSIIAAALLEFKECLDSPAGLNVDILPIIIGVVTAAVVGYFAIVLFKWLLKTNKMIIFIVYTAVVGIAVIVISIIEMQSGCNLFTGVPII